MRGYARGYLGGAYQTRSLSDRSPARTSVAWSATADRVVTLEQLRADLGLFDDDTEDELLTEHLLTATERIGSMVDGVLVGLPVVDWYPALARRLVLSQRSVTAATSITLTVRERETPGVETTIPAADWHVDASADPPALVMTSAALSAWSLAEPLDYENPVSVSYTPPAYEDGGHTVNLEAVRAGVRYMVTVLYESRGTGVLPVGWERNLNSLLGAASLAV